MSALVRPARRGDADRIAAIHAASWRRAYRGILPRAYLSRLSPEVLLERWRRRLPVGARAADDAPVWVVEDCADDAPLGPGQVAGFAQLGPCHEPSDYVGFAGEVNMLYVDPTATGRGLGRALLDRSCEVLAAREHYWLVIWVLARNQRGRRFYERADLRPDGGRRHDRFAGHEVTVLRYAKPLNPIIDFPGLIRGPRSLV
ncbi:N-acetyltransferase family protein [Haliangium sp.]|uniref:GNAT family N-acetyltransferase n=1 Tax=Haliangium sp. TaxID=2663208 RepID=UPI003D152061